MKKRTVQRKVDEKKLADQHAGRRGPEGSGNGQEQLGEVGQGGYANDADQALDTTAPPSGEKGAGSH